MAFHDVLFPADISYGATGGPRFSTVINTVGSGREERIIRWDQPLMSWDVGHEITDETKLEALLAFFRAREGRAHGFRFKDWSDYSAGMILGPNGREYGPVAAAHPVVLEGGEYRLYKRYASGGTIRHRRITKPEAGTIRLYDAGGNLLTRSTDGLTGVVSGGPATSWAGKFHVPVRFEDDELKISIRGVRRGNWPNVGLVELRE